MSELSLESIAAGLLDMLALMAAIGIGKEEFDVW